MSGRFEQSKSLWFTMNIRWYIAIPCVLVLSVLAIIGWRVRVLTAKTKLIVAADTTVVLEPVRPDGTIDYEAALNARYSVGITPENNAAALLDQVFQPAFESLELKIRYYQYLGVSEPLRGQCLISESEFATQSWGPRNAAGPAHIAFDDPCRLALSKPWARADYPDIATWIDLNNEPLRLIEQASHRPRLFDPLVTSGYLISSQVPLTQNLRVAARVLVTRAMQRISEGDLEAAAYDLMTCHRLSRLLGQHATLIGNLVGLAVDALATAGDQTLLSAGLTADQARTYLAELQSLPPLPDFARTLDQSERLVLLDTLQIEWASGEKSMVQNFLPIKLSGLDINTILRHTNSSFDQLVAAMRLATLKDRQTAVVGLNEDLKARVKETISGHNILSSAAFGGRKEISEKVADVYMQMTGSSHPQLLIGKNRAETRFELLQIGIALAIYRAEKGEYPATLEELTPAFLKVIPLDPFVDKPLHYKRYPDDQIQNEGFLLYSVGEDEKDDGGIVPTEGNPKDLVFRVIHAEKVKP